MWSKRIVERNRLEAEKKLNFPLEPYPEWEIDELNYSLRGVDWDNEDSSRVISGLPEEAQRLITTELLLSKLDFRHFATRYCHILDDKGNLSRLKLWPSQEDFMKMFEEAEESAYSAWDAGEMPDLMVQLALILLKSRQIGGTVISQALLAHQFFFGPNTQAVIASDHPDNSNKLWMIQLRIFENMPGWMRPKRDAKVKATNLHLNELDSDLIVGAGNQKTTLGQGMTVPLSHLTEVSTFLPENALAIDADLRPAYQSSRRHHKFLIVESTGAGGRGNWFHDQFQAARNKKSLFKSIFIGWFKCPDKWAIPSKGIEIRPEIQNLGERIEKENNLKVSKDQLAWYQTTRDDYEERHILELFLQEYPSSIDEAFTTGLKSVIPIEVRTRIRDKLRIPLAIFDVNFKTSKLRRVDRAEWLIDPSTEKYFNRVVLWENPEPGYLYAGGVDTSYGMEGKDRSSIEIIRIGNRWKPDEQVAQFIGTCAPDQLAIPCEILGNIFADRSSTLPALLAVEVNPGSPGIVTQTELIRRNYKNFYIWRRPLKLTGSFTKEVGWWTTETTRPLITDTGRDALIREELLVNSAFTVDELNSFVYTYTQSGRRRMDHAPGYHDDSIMALFIARYIAHEQDVQNIAEQRRIAEDRRTAKVPEKDVQFCELGISWEEAMSNWEKKFGL